MWGGMLEEYCFTYSHVVSSAASLILSFSLIPWMIHSFSFFSSLLVGSLCFFRFWIFSRVSNTSNKGDLWYLVPWPAFHHFHHLFTNRHWYPFRIFSFIHRSITFSRFYLTRLLDTRKTHAVTLILPICFHTHSLPIVSFLNLEHGQHPITQCLNPTKYPRMPLWLRIRFW